MLGAENSARREGPWLSGVARLYRVGGKIRGMLVVRSAHMAVGLARGDVVYIDIIIPSGHRVRFESRVRMINQKTGTVKFSMPAPLARLLARDRELPAAIEMPVQLVSIFSTGRPLER